MIQEAYTTSERLPVWCDVCGPSQASIVAHFTEIRMVGGTSFQMNLCLCTREMVVWLLIIHYTEEECSRTQTLVML